MRTEHFKGDTSLEKKFFELKQYGVLCSHMNNPPVQFMEFKLL